MRRILGIILIIVMIIPTFSFAESNTFSDLSEEHWAYDAVMTMTELGIISGYEDGTFRPNEPITRGEFATIMVKTLGLSPKHGYPSSFVDLDDDHWVVPYVEAAKPYLTGYSSSAGVKFKPNEAAVREDMAVAILKAKSFDVSSSNDSYLDNYGDKNSVSPSLMSYVGSAIKNDVMVGSVKNGVKMFKPQAPLTRAEAAVLLLKLIDDEVKIVLENQGIQLNVDVRDHDLLLKWDVEKEEGLTGIKVVASKSNSQAIYPEDGYVKYLSADTRAVELSGKLTNNNGDTSYIEPGESYYFSITGLYEDGNVSSNSEFVLYPGQSLSSDIVLEGIQKEGQIVLEWASDTSSFDGYKVVASKSDGTPIYPEDGYYKYIGQNDQKRVEIPVGAYYNNGDISKFEAGKTYYFSITGLQGDQKIASNTVALSFTAGQASVVKLVGNVVDGNVHLEWTEANDSNISGFKVVASKNDSTPMYSENGYYKYYPKGSGFSTTISAGDSYNSGDFSKFEAGQAYYFSITTLYNDGKVASNTLRLTMGGETPAPLAAPEVTLSGVVDGSNIILEWTSYNDSHVEGFKVVASKSDATPQYPDNGYYKYIRIGNDERVVISAGDSYNSGDISYFEKGQSYYFSITTLYEGKKVSSNVIKLNF